MAYHSYLVEQKQNYGIFVQVTLACKNLGRFYDNNGLYQNNGFSPPHILQENNSSDLTLTKPSPLRASAVWQTFEK